MDERHCLARKGGDFALINKLVTEIGHTSKKEAGGATWTDRGPEVLEPSRLPSRLVHQARGNRILALSGPGDFVFLSHNITL